MVDKEFEDFKRDDFETYEFTRFMRSADTEFYFIVGINNRDQFDEYWDGRSKEVLGYLVSYIDPERELLNYIYLIEDEKKNDEEIIKYTKQFASGIYAYTEHLELDFVIRKTDVYQKSISLGEEIDFVKRVVIYDLPEHVFTD
ncbi:hypothetical protein JMA_09190 [Jeotgalibacillus malaysiensis]|uniref:Uncharacterized protein n=1 Tax=Jeotgalibacillus malaysiensis TaxID=1508404 RepID=A0A0B5AJK7_9BACL|nr:hypothetical protein [Jeotgalibacillus malaysiensis]AJD90236.1 hypothetical protein JMA_09190 [Jeotgalibacillus malaysiensis]